MSLNNEQWRDLYTAFKRSGRAREAAIQQAVAAGDAVVPWLVECLRDNNWYVRWAAVTTLKRIGNTTVVDCLLRSLPKQPSHLALAIEILQYIAPQQAQVV